MKQLNNFILEKLKINSKSKINHYNYKPKDKWELRELVDKLINERGKNADLNDIDVSEITDLSGLFFKLDPYDIKIDRWNVSNVENMRGAFYACKNFNCDLSNWNVSKVIDMENLFSFCINFNSDISKWDVKNVENMNYTFFKCRSFNYDLNNWNTQSLKKTNIVNTFKESKLEDNDNIPDWYKNIIN